MKWSEWLGGVFTGKQSITTNGSCQVAEWEEMKEERGGIFRIRTAGHLFWVSRMVNQKGYNFQDKTLVLESDIDFGGYEWTPIGLSLQKSFCGVFDGCGKSISGLRIDSGEAYVGFFGVVTGVNKLMMAEICRLHLADAQVSGKRPGAYVGGLIGYAQEGVRIDKCSVSGRVESTYCAGGIVGCGEDCVSIRNCQCSGQVGSHEIVGGVVGELVTNSIIVNCGNFMNDRYGRPEDLIVGRMDETSMVR